MADTANTAKSRLTCAFCGKRAQGNCWIYKGGPAPVPCGHLCNACHQSGIDHAEIWRRIAWIKTRAAKKMVTRG